jgi:hypothetical protein
MPASSATETSEHRAANSRFRFGQSKTTRTSAFGNLSCAAARCSSQGLNLDDRTRRGCIGPGLSRDPDDEAIGRQRRLPSVSNIHRGCSDQRLRTLFCDACRAINAAVRKLLPAWSKFHIVARETSQKRMGHLPEAPVLRPFETASALAADLTLEAPDTRKRKGAAPSS